MARDTNRSKLIIDLFKAAVASRMEENKKRNLIDLQELLRITKFTKQEIKMMYRGFKQVRQRDLAWAGVTAALIRLPPAKSYNRSDHKMSLV